MFLREKVNHMNKFVSTPKLEKMLKINKKVSWIYEIIDSRVEVNNARLDGVENYFNSNTGQNYLNKIKDKEIKDQLQITDNDILGPREIIKIGRKMFSKGLSLSFNEDYIAKRGTYKLGNLNEFITYEGFIKSKEYMDFINNYKKYISRREFNKIIVVEYTKVIS